VSPDGRAVAAWLPGGVSAAEAALWVPYFSHLLLAVFFFLNPEHTGPAGA